jgi:lipopolysaccharide/colanic/teichoic acid biosynthesis glycosyltransferase
MPVALTPSPNPETIESRLDSPRRWPEIESLDPSVPVPIEPVVNWYSATKSWFDWTLAAIILIPALPVIGLCWLAVRLTSSGPGFYLQSRLGRGGREYRIVKLRTMAHDTELKTGGPKWSTKGDCRITPVGRFLRKTHLDELPQLFNVLAGQMSLVGPRPERRSIIEKLELNTRVPGYPHRLLIRPGVTGLAQVQLPADEDVNSVKHKVVYDLYYIENFSVWLDLRILTATLFKAAGLKPRWTRRLCWLPRREAVAEVLHAKIAPPVAAATNLQPI